MFFHNRNEQYRRAQLVDFYFLQVFKQENDAQFALSAQIHIYFMFIAEIIKLTTLNGTLAYCHCFCFNALNRTRELVDEKVLT